MLDLWPDAAQVWRAPALVAFVSDTLGPVAGLVRTLYFDKPPEQSWTLPFHRDMTIAVRDASVPVAGFAHPTRKAGVPHLEAPPSLLERMLTLRIHLDAMTEENGPLSLIPGSHRHEAPPEESGDAVTPLGPAGDVLAMRPLVLHGSRHTRAGVSLHRRILHLEFAADPTLPGGLAWHTFLPVRHDASGRASE